VTLNSSRQKGTSSLTSAPRIILNMKT